METPFKGKSGTEKFIRRFEKELGEKESFYLSQKEAKEKIKISIERIKKEIEEDIKREKNFHPQIPSSTISDMTNILAQAVQIALEEGVEESIRFIFLTNNPHLLDSLHDILIEHFFDALVSSGKIKIIK